MAGTTTAFVIGIIVFCVAALAIFIGVAIAVWCYFRRKKRNQKLEKNELHTIPYDSPLHVSVGHNNVYGHSNTGYISPVTLDSPSPRSNAVFTLPNQGVLNADYVDFAGHRPRRHSFDMGNDRKMYTVKEGTLVRQERKTREKSRDTRSLVGSTNTLLSNGSRVRTGTLVRPVYAHTMTTLGSPRDTKRRQVVKSNSVLVGFEPISNKKIALMEDQRYQSLSLAGSPRSLSPPGSPISRRHYSARTESANYYGHGVDDPDGNVVRWSPSMRRKMEAKTRMDRLENVSSATSRHETPLAERKEYDLGEKKFLYTMNGDLQVYPH